MHINNVCSSEQSQKISTIAGYSLLEILISLCILSFGLLGFMQAQLLALHTEQAAYQKSISQIGLSSEEEAVQACHLVACALSADSE